MPEARPRARKSRSPRWAQWDSERLLALRFCDLDVRVEGSPLEAPIDRVREELSARDIEVDPHFWIADEWYSPAGVPGVAVPFFLTHPRLMRLERQMMLSVEGGTRAAATAILRHEVGHAVQHAFGLQRRRRWRALFGNASKTYPDSYLPNPASRRFVQHLDGWYAQSHPEEDFAETFAVWLRPRSQWRARYAGWPAIKKLEYMDELMDELAATPPRVRSRSKPYAISGLRGTLRHHYEKKRAHYSPGFSDAYDRDLTRLFSATGGRRSETAAAFLRRHRAEIRQLVSRWTGDYMFTLDQVLKEMIGRVTELKLRASGPQRRLLLDFVILLTVHSVHLHRRREWHAV